MEQRRDDDWAPVMDDTEAVIHLAGTLQPRRPNTYRSANLETVERLLDATSSSPVQRIVFLSYVGADPNSDNEYLRTKGEAEEVIRGSGIPSVVVHATFIYGDSDDIGPSFASYQTEAGRTVSVLGNGTQRIAPMHVDDLAGVLAAAALNPTTPAGTFKVSGPEILALDEFVRSINPGGVKIRHLPAPVARLLAWFTPQLTPALVDVLLSNSVAVDGP